MNKRNNARGASGFTLVELLVVIGIIALLISILLPALNMARVHANRVACMSNMKQLGMAWMMYGDDFKGTAPAANMTGVEVACGTANWLYVRPAGQANMAVLAGYTPLQCEQVVMTGAFYKYLKSTKVFRCPFDQGPFNMLDSSGGYVYHLTSYGMNGGVDNYAGAYAGRQKIWFKISKFKKDAIILYEPDSNSSQSGNYFNDGGNKPEEGMCLRHASRAVAYEVARQTPAKYLSMSSNVVMADGSVASISLQDYEKECYPAQYGKPAKSPSRLYIVPVSIDPTGGNPGN